MAWIESHQELARHPKTKKLARLLGVTIPTAIGHLHLLWWWAMDYAQDGSLSRYDENDLADALMWDGNPGQLREALCDSDFVDRDTDTIHDWEDYAGRLLDKRRADAERKKTSRNRPKDVQGTSDGHPTDGAGTVPNRTIPNLQDQKKDLRSPPAHGALFEQVWAIYPVHKEKQKALEIWRKEKLDSVFDEIRDAIERQNATKKANDAAGKFYPEFPYLHRWLKGRRWTDEISGEEAQSHGSSAAPDNQPDGADPELSKVDWGKFGTGNT